MDLAGYAQQFETAMESKLRQAKDRAGLYRLKIENLSPEKTLLRKKQNLEMYKLSLNSIMTDAVKGSREHLKVLSERLAGLSPLKRISEGYAFVADESGRAVASIENVKEGQRIRVNVSDGAISARVEGTEQLKYGE